MSTPDVPGARPENGDELHVGCWAEHTDGSLIFVEGIEKTKNNAESVIFVVFDLATDPIVEYRDAMEISAFKSYFSWKPGDRKSIKWTWHDKTPFDWNRVLSKARPGVKYSDVEDQLTAAERVARSRNLKGSRVGSDLAPEDEDVRDESAARRTGRRLGIDPKPIDEAFLKSLSEKGRAAVNHILDGIQKAVDSLRR